MKQWMVLGWLLVASVQAQHRTMDSAVSGRSVTNPSSMSYNGQLSNVPHIFALEPAQSGNGIHRCSATKISTKAFITAAHCMTASGTFQIKNPLNGEFISVHCERHPGYVKGEVANPASYEILTYTDYRGQQKTLRKDLDGRLSNSIINDVAVCHSEGPDIAENDQYACIESVQGIQNNYQSGRPISLIGHGTHEHMTNKQTFAVTRQQFMNGQLNGPARTYATAMRSDLDRQQRRIDAQFGGRSNSQFISVELSPVSNPNAAVGGGDSGGFAGTVNNGVVRINGVISYGSMSENVLEDLDGPGTKTRVILNANEPPSKSGGIMSLDDPNIRGFIQAYAQRNQQNLCGINTTPSSSGNSSQVAESTPPSSNPVVQPSQPSPPAQAQIIPPGNQGQGSAVASHVPPSQGFQQAPQAQGSTAPNGFQAFNNFPPGTEGLNAFGLPNQFGFNSFNQNPFGFNSFNQNPFLFNNGFQPVRRPASMIILRQPTFFQRLFRPFRFGVFSGRRFF